MVSRVKVVVERRLVRPLGDREREREREREERREEMEGVETIVSDSSSLSADTVVLVAVLAAVVERWCASISAKA